MNDTAETMKRPWQPMDLSYVGNLGDVMEAASKGGTKNDPDSVLNNKK